MKMIRIPANLVVVFLLFIGCALTQAMPMTGKPSEKSFKGKMQEMLESVKTGDDHRAIAKAYDEEAVKARMLAAEHREMAKWYRETRQINKAAIYFRIRKHCDRLVKFYTSLANEYIALAEEHKKIASQFNKIPNDSD